MTTPIQIITRGGGNLERLKILLSLTSIKSERVIKGVTFYHVNGLTDETLGALGYDIPNIRRAVKKVNEIASKVEKIKELDWYNLGYGNGAK